MIRLCQKAHEQLKKDSGMSDPYSRGDADAVFAYLVKLSVDELGFSAYVGKDENDGDNGDNGHFILNTYGLYWTLTQDEKILWKSRK